MPRNRVVMHFINPHLPSVDTRTGLRNIFYVTEDGQVSRFVKEPPGSTNVEKIPYSRIPLWCRSKQVDEGWIPVTISRRGEVIE